MAGLTALPLAVALGSALVQPGTASAGTIVTKATKVTESNWFWNKTAQIPPEVLALLPVQPPALPEQDLPIPDGILVPKGDLAVSYRGEPSGEPDRETYLTFDLGGATPGATVKSFSFTLKVDQSNLTNVKSGDVPLIACFPTRFWDKGTGAAVWSAKPQDDCDGAPAGKFDAAKQTYTFQVASFAQDWADGTNIGVAIRHAKSQTTPFILAFQGPATVTGKIAYAPALPDAPSVPVAPIVKPVAPVVSDGGTVSGPAVTVPDVIPAVPTAPMPGVTVAPNTFTPAGGTHAIGATTFEGRFWMSMLLGVLGVGLLAFYVGRRPVPVKATTTQMSRLSQVLSARASHAAETSPPL